MKLILQAIKSLLNKINIRLAKLEEQVVPSDWNAADGDPGHVLNRTHYMIPGGEVIIPETEFVSDNDSLWSAPLPVIFLNVGRSYIVNFNGEEYVCEAKNVNFPVAGTIALGDASLAAGERTDDPFVLLAFDASTAAQVGKTVAVMLQETSDITSLVMSVVAADYYSPIDKQYLPKEVVSASETAEAALEAAETAMSTADGSLRKIDAKGTGSIAFNIANISDVGLRATVFGYHCMARGNYSVAIGYMCSANAHYGVAFGESTAVYNPNTFAIGRYNVRSDEKSYAFIVGNGTGLSSDEPSVRFSDAHRLDWDGNAWYSGTLESAGLILTSPSGTKYKITVADDGTLASTAVE